MEVTKPKKWGKNIGLGEGIGLGILEMMDAATKRVSEYKKKEAKVIDNETGEVVDAKS